MPKLHEILAIGQGKKSEVEKELGDAYKSVQKADAFDGHQKTYQPIEDKPDAEQLPPDNKRVQRRLPDVVRKFNDRLVELFDVILTMDAGNQGAEADIVVDNKVLAEKVPVPTLLFLLKELTNLKTFITALPTPDPADQWSVDPNQGLLATPAFQTHRTKKEPTVIVKYDATDKHPAQTELFHKDILAGYWTTIKYTSRIPEVLKAQMLTRVGKLLDAVKVAKEQANGIEVEKRKMGVALLGYVFGDYLA